MLVFQGVMLRIFSPSFSISAKKNRHLRASDSAVAEDAAEAAPSVATALLLSTGHLVFLCQIPTESSRFLFGGGYCTYYARIPYM